MTSEENYPLSPERNNTVLRLFGIPAVITVIAVMIYFLFGMIASEKKDISDYLDEIQFSEGNKRWQAAFDLSRVLKESPEIQEDELLRVLALLKETKEEAQVQRYLAVALGTLSEKLPVESSPRVEEELGSLLQTSSDNDTLIFGMWALARVAKGESSLKVVRGFLGHEDSDVRKMAVYSYGYLLGRETLASKVEEKEFIEPLEARIRDGEPLVRFNAATALARLGNAKGGEILKKLLLWPIEDPYLKSLSQPDLENIQVSAILAAERLSLERFHSEIETLSEKSESVRVRNEALQALKN